VALRTFQYAVTIPAGTPIATPVVTPIALDNWEIESLDVEVPEGPSGLVGFYLENNGIAWLPHSPGQWIVWDGRNQTFYPTDWPNASGWALVGYNLGQYPHTVTMRFHVNAPETPTPPTPPVSLTFVTSPPPLPVTVLS
jgi:hypothetical protein